MNFNEETLRDEIKKKWGAFGAHIDLYDTIMKKLIDLDDETIKALSHMAIDAGTNLKAYIQSVLVAHAGGQKGTLRKIKKSK